MQSHFLLPGILALQDAQMDASTMRQGQRQHTVQSKEAQRLCDFSASQGLVIDDHPYER